MHGELVGKWAVSLKQAQQNTEIPGPVGRGASWKCWGQHHETVTPLCGAGLHSACVPAREDVCIQTCTRASVTIQKEDLQVPELLSNPQHSHFPGRTGNGAPLACTRAWLREWVRGSRQP